MGQKSERRDEIRGRLGLVMGEDVDGGGRNDRRTFIVRGVMQAENVEHQDIDRGEYVEFLGY